MENNNNNLNSQQNPTSFLQLFEEEFNKTKSKELELKENKIAEEKFNMLSEEVKKRIAQIENNIDNMYKDLKELEKNMLNMQVDVFNNLNKRADQMKAENFLKAMNFLKEEIKKNFKKIFQEIKEQKIILAEFKSKVVVDLVVSSDISKEVEPLWAKIKKSMEITLNNVKKYEYYVSTMSSPRFFKECEQSAREKRNKIKRIRRHIKTKHKK